eukprot:TRINITY_DN28221_c0_g1_i2.p1 TRINITY_DN28221_c0_g1~~TRINITY_DN28221_c0_g1_i2.p1  ORF type:complete len:267 (+),score=94.04 TRINITY_DN28221_c0_g1_i2:306-1106(+)
MDQSTNGLPEQAVNYLRNKKIPDLMEHLLHELVVHQPENPLKFLAQTLSSPVTLKLILCGPPAGGKKTQCEMLSEKFGLVHVSARDLLTKEVTTGSSVGKLIESHMVRGELVPDSVIVDLIQARLSQDDAVKKGWLIEGFPRTKNQALSLQTAGLIPQAFIHIDLPETVVTERIEGRRHDPVTHRVYHLAFDPPSDPEVISRLEQRVDDTKERASKRLAAYYRNTVEIEHCYKSVIHRIDGDKGKSDIAEDLTNIVKTIREGEDFI